MAENESFGVYEVKIGPDILWAIFSKNKCRNTNKVDIFHPPVEWRPMGYNITLYTCHVPAAAAAGWSIASAQWGPFDRRVDYIGIGGKLVSIASDRYQFLHSG